MEKQPMNAYERSVKILNRLGLQAAGPVHQPGVYRHGDVAHSATVLALALMGATVVHVAEAIQLGWLLAIAAAVVAYRYQGHRWPSRGRRSKALIALETAAILLIFTPFLVAIAVAVVALRYHATHHPRPLTGVLAMGEFFDESGAEPRDFAVYAEDVDALLAGGALNAELARLAGVAPDAIATGVTPMPSANAGDLPAQLMVGVKAGDEILGTATVVVARLPVVHG